MIMAKKLDGRAVHKTNQILTTFLINPPTLHSTGVRHTCPSFQSRTRALPSRAASACAGEQAQTHKASRQNLPTLFTRPRHAGTRHKHTHKKHARCLPLWQGRQVHLPFPHRLPLPAGRRVSLIGEGLWEARAGPPRLTHSFPPSPYPHPLHAQVHRPQFL